MSVISMLRIDRRSRGVADIERTYSHADQHSKSEDGNDSSAERGKLSSGSHVASS
jgi:hypothetical protein